MPTIAETVDKIFAVTRKNVLELLQEADAESEGWENYFEISEKKIREFFKIESQEVHHD